MTLPLGHDIHAVVHPVDQVDVRMTRRAEHHLRSFGQSFGRMRREIMWAEISFYLHNAADAFHAIADMDKMFSKQFLRDENRVAIIEGARQFSHGLCRESQAYLRRIKMDQASGRNLSSLVVKRN